MKQIKDAQNTTKTNYDIETRIKMVIEHVINEREDYLYMWNGYEVHIMWGAFTDKSLPDWVDVTISHVCGLECHIQIEKECTVTSTYQNNVIGLHSSISSGCIRLPIEVWEELF